MTYTCPSCGETHDSWPALAFRAPDSYVHLSVEEKESIAFLNSDFCVIEYPDQTDRFIRVVMTQKVNDHCSDLEYGIWVSLSEKNFHDYNDNFDNPNHQVQYFGWLSNKLPDYTFKDYIPCLVQTRPDGQRPEIAPRPDFEHPFVQDYYNGITKAEAELRIQMMFNRGQNPN